MRPRPTSPQAWLPEAGPKTLMSRLSSRFAGWPGWPGSRHMAWFMAGATATAASVASTRVVSRSSAMPWAKRAIRSAVAGAISTRSAHLASSIWPIGGFGRRVQQVQVDRVPGQGLHGQRGDELCTATGHDHAHFARPGRSGGEPGRRSCRRRYRRRRPEQCVSDTAAA